MAGRIQGITAPIGGDTTKLQTALKGVNTEIRNTQSQLRDVDKLLKLYPGNTELLVKRLSFSHIREIMVLEDEFERFFYETQCIKCGWTVRELRRQIKTNLYFRSGVSKNPKELLKLSEDNPEGYALSIKDPFTFEFLGLDASGSLNESELEQALIDHLQKFMLELGEGFCFEARQKRIVIDNKYYFIDLVFYNRLLHCNVIVELKNDEFKHEDLGQLNAYVGYYKVNEMIEGDNPPVGILLCTDKGAAGIRQLEN